MTFIYFALCLLIISALQLFKRASAHFARTSAVLLAFLVAVGLLTWSASLASVFSNSEISMRGVFFVQLVAAGLVFKLLPTAVGKRSEDQLEFVISPSNLAIGAAAAAIIFFSTYPHLLPSWGNVDFAQHVAMVDSLRLSLLDLSPHSISVGDWQKSYPYLFGFHLFTAFFQTIVPIDPLIVMHGCLSLAYGLLVSSVLELSECKNALIRFSLACLTLFILPIHSFIRLGWAPHLWGTAISAFSFVFFTRAKILSAANPRLHGFLMLALIWMASAAYPFCGIATGLGMIWVQYRNGHLYLKSLKIIGIVGLLILLPLMLQPILVETITVSLKRIFNPNHGELYHALRVGSQEALVSPTHWVLFFVIGAAALFSRDSAQSLIFYVYVFLLIVFIILLGRGAYIVDKVLHTLWPIVLAIIAYQSERLVSLKALDKKFKYSNSFLQLATFLIATYFVFQSSYKVFEEKREPFLTRDELTLVRQIQNSNGDLKLLILGYSGAKEFLFRHMLQDGVWAGPFTRENYHISGPCEEICAEVELEKFKAYSGKKALLVNRARIPPANIHSDLGLITKSENSDAILLIPNSFVLGE